MKVVIDMNLSQEWQPALTARGIDAVHWTHVGAGNAPDSEIADWAQVNGAVILTRDLDFGMLMATANRPMPGIIQLRLDQVGVAAHMKRVLETLAQYGAELRSGALITLSADKIRIRSSSI